MEQSYHHTLFFYRTIVQSEDIVTINTVLNVLNILGLNNRFAILACLFQKYVTQYVLILGEEVAIDNVNNELMNVDSVRRLEQFVGG